MQAVLGSRLAAARPAAPRGAALAVCAKPAKAADFRGLSVEEIDKEVASCKRQLFDLRMKQATRQEFKPSDFGVLTRKVAVLLTVRREMEIAKGITRRESRRMEKRAKLADKNTVLA